MAYHTDDCYGSYGTRHDCAGTCALRTACRKKTDELRGAYEGEDDDEPEEDSCYGNYEEGMMRCSGCSYKWPCSRETSRRFASVSIHREAPTRSKEVRVTARDDGQGESIDRKLREGENPGFRLLKSIVLGVLERVSKEVIYWVRQLHW